MTQVSAGTLECTSIQISLSRILAYWADKQPQSPAVTLEGRSVTYSQLDARSNRLARAYQNLGVNADDFVTIALPNSIEYFESLFAIWKLGAIPQPVSARLPKHERDQIIELAKPALIVGVSDDTYKGITTIAPDFEADARLPDTPLAEKSASSRKVMTSGGSTGRPKLIVASQPATYDPNIEHFNLRPGGCLLIPGPLYHNGPFSAATVGVFKGNHVVIMARFDAETTLQLIEQHHVDTTSFVPTMMQRIWTLPEKVRLNYDVSSLQTLWHLAAPCPEWLKLAYIDWLGAEVIWEMYGATENLGNCRIRGDEWLTHRGSVGKSVGNCELKIVDENGEQMPPGDVGELYIRPITGPGTTYRYIGAQANTLEGGWETLGDMGYMDEEGYLYLTDRRADMILSGGANIYPAEVEHAIEAFPGVRSSAVIGLPHEDLGSVVHAIVDAPNGDVGEDSLLEFLSDRLARYKQPRSVEFTNEPLRDDAGKLRRRALRDERLIKS